jgi:hypothetical protein
MNGWIETLTNEQLKPFGLVKPIDYEPWHITLISLVGISQKEKEKIRDSVLNPPKVVKDELAEALKIIADKADIDYETWYKLSKDSKTKYTDQLKYLDYFMIKVAKSYGGK